jgi:hypothetical protein
VIGMGKLTKPQKRYLAEIREQPGRAYNGRARRTLEALEEAGLIEYDFDLIPHADSGSGVEFTERFTCHPRRDLGPLTTTQAAAAAMARAIRRLESAAPERREAAEQDVLDTARALDKALEEGS